MLMENRESGEKEAPLYFGSPDLRAEDLVGPEFILLAAPSADQGGKRVVGFLDQSVKVIDEADFQAQMKAQQKPPISD
jgi:hypothetical protein